MISLNGLNKAEVLAALYNASRPQGVGFFEYEAEPMTTEEAEVIFYESDGKFDYLKGRVMKVDLTGDEFNPVLYDRDNGAGAAQAAVETCCLTE